MQEINPKHIQELLSLINHSPYFELLSMKGCELGIGYSKIEVDLARKHLNPFGSIHGGVYASVIDAAAYWAVYCELEENIGFTSLDVKVDNLSPIKEGKMIIRGKSLKIGRSICLAEATVKDTQGKLLAYGTSKLMIVQGRQSIDQAIESMGCPPLPPKFIEKIRHRE